MKRFSKALEKHRLRKSKVSQDEQVHLKECPKNGHSSNERFQKEVEKESLNTRKVGAMQEETACKYLLQNGIRIKERNFRCRLGEIDLIGYDGEYLVFFEVKYRNSASGRGSAAEAVGIAKQKKICRVSDYYRLIHGCPSDTPIRYDVIAIDGDEIQWFRNAFAYYGT